MLIAKSSLSHTCKLPFQFLTRNAKKPYGVAAFANKKDLPKDPIEKSKPLFQIKVPNKILAQSAIGVLALGFIDAGYSGDWSRIGVISKDNEDLLKAAAFIVVPLCLFLIYSVSETPEDE